MKILTLCLLLLCSVSLFAEENEDKEKEELLHIANEFAACVGT